MSNKLIDTHRSNNQESIWNDVASSIEFTITPDFQLFQKFTPKNFRILDYGCGYGRITKKLKDIVVTAATCSFGITLLH